jgi:glutathione S-transferase
MKLYYFDIYGRAESIRFLLSHAKVEYENVLINGEKLAEMKASGVLEFGQVPMFEADGKHYCQSWAILRFLGRKYGYYPEDPETAWKIDSTIDAVEDYFNGYFKYNFEKDEERKKVAKENWLKMLPIWVSAIEKRITENGGKYVAGDKLTIADFALASAGFNMLLNEANPHYAESLPLVKDHEILKAYSHRLREDLAERLANRPQPRPI